MGHPEVLRLLVLILHYCVYTPALRKKEAASHHSALKRKF